jgi:hypothetical protein
MHIIPDKPTIFLDIDGVLSTNNEYFMSTKNFWDKYKFAKKIGIKYSFNEKCINVFNNILTEIDCQIILSSDWRKRYTLEEMDKIFRFNGVLQSPIAFTPVFESNFDSLDRVRAAEIDTSIAEHNITNYVIIDDLRLDYFFADRFVLTDDFQGIKKSGIKDKILAFLKDGIEG